MSGDAGSQSGVPLRVLSDPTPRVIGWGRRWRTRLTILVVVQVAMILHIVVWWIGLPFGWETLSPVEPSESIVTVSDGIINAGAIFFAAALLSTAVLGRWFCGWGCHVVLLQDWCLRLMRRAGVRPRAFRSRLLMLAPFVLASYMFLWPVFYRLVWAPLVESRTPEWHGFRLELLTRDLWATMPGVGVGIAFLFICGFATVYVLGAKGFCTYGCPYGGFFAPIDRLSLRRVTVSDACRGCAHCTAACTSNVRVHEQVATWGKVIDVGCMKTTDCIEACPNDALSMQWSLPVLRSKPPQDVQAPRKRWDLSWTEEVILAAIMLMSVLAWRGSYGLVPLLMSLGVASILTWMLWKSSRLLRDPAASFHRSVLKKSGALTRTGGVFLAITVLASLATVQAGATRVMGSVADSYADGLRRRINSPIRTGVSQMSLDEAADARVAIEWYTLAGSIGRGGIGFADDPNHLLAMARLHAGLGAIDEAAALLQETESIAKPNQDVAIESFMVRVSTHPPENVLLWADGVLRTHVDWAGLRRICVQWALARGDLRAASRLSAGPDIWKYEAMARVQAGDLKQAVLNLRRYLNAAPGDALAWVTLARVLLQDGDVTAADAAAAEAHGLRGGFDPSARGDLDRELEAYEFDRRQRDAQSAP